MLTKDELAQIEEVVEGALKAANMPLNSRSEFYISAKEHYDQHERIDRFLSMFESASSVVAKTLIVFFILGVIGLIALGFKFRQ